MLGKMLEIGLWVSPLASQVARDPLFDYGSPLILGSPIDHPWAGRIKAPLHLDVYVEMSVKGFG